MSAKSTFALIALSAVGGAVGVAVGIKMLATKYGLMKKVMFTARKSKLDFEETVSAISESAINNGWEIPQTYDLQQEYLRAGHEDMTRLKVLYFCNPDGGYKILRDDIDKPMSVMMPMPVSVYETSDGQVYIAALNLGSMSMMFGVTVKEVLKEGAENYAKTLEDIAEESHISLNLSRIPAIMMGRMMEHMPDE